MRAASPPYQLDGQHIDWPRSVQPIEKYLNFKKKNHISFWILFCLSWSFQKLRKRCRKRIPTSVLGYKGKVRIFPPKIISPLGGQPKKIFQGYFQGPQHRKVHACQIFGLAHPVGKSPKCWRLEITEIFLNGVTESWLEEEFCHTRLSSHENSIKYFIPVDPKSFLCSGASRLNPRERGN